MTDMKLLRVKEAADLLGVKAASIRQLERRGILVAVRDWNRHRRFKDLDVLKLKESLLGTGEGSSKGGTATQTLDEEASAS